MKKNTVEMMLAYLNGETVDTDSLKTEVAAEFDRLTAKSREKADAYAVAHDVVMAAMSDAPMTAREIYDACADDLPDDFTSNKVQYALRNYWADEVDAHEPDGRGPKTYSRKA